MANAYTLNQVPALYGNAHFLLFTMLLGAGWTVKSSGDGLAAFSPTTTVFTAANTGAPGANAYGQNLAWIRLQDPGGGRELVIQRNAAQGVRIKYSAVSHFTGGAPSATQTPSAADEQYIAGGGTDAAPTYLTQYLSTSANVAGCKFQGAAFSAAPYGFWFGGTVLGSGQTNTGFMMDPDTGEGADTDPVVFAIAGNSANLAYKASGLSDASESPTINAVGYNPCFWNTARTVWLSAGALGYFYLNTNAQVFGSGGAISSFTGNAVGLPVFWYRVGTLPTATGPKGISTLMRWTGNARSTSLDTAGNNAWICMGDVYLPWDGVTTPTQ